MLQVHIHVYVVVMDAASHVDQNRRATLAIVMQDMPWMKTEVVLFGEDGYIEDIANGKCLRCPYSQQNDEGVHTYVVHGSCKLSNSTVTQEVKAVCECNQGGAWYGEACDKCDLCGKHGICTVDNTTNSQDIICQCKDRFIGKKCDECERNNMISPDGRCIACTQECGATGSCTAEGHCVCRSGVGKYQTVKIPRKVLLKVK